MLRGIINFIFFIFGGSQEKKRVLEWYLFKKDIELPQRCVSKFCAICVATQCRNLDMK